MADANMVVKKYTLVKACTFLWVVVLYCILREPANGCVENQQKCTTYCGRFHKHPIGHGAVPS